MPNQNIELTAINIPEYSYNSRIYYISEEVDKEIEASIFLLPVIDYTTDIFSDTNYISKDIEQSSIDFSNISVSYSTDFESSYIDDGDALDGNFLNYLLFNSNKEVGYNNALEDGEVLDSFQLVNSINNYYRDITSGFLDTKSFSLTAFNIPTHSHSVYHFSSAFFDKVLLLKSNTYYDYTAEASNWTANDFFLLPNNPAVNDGILFGFYNPRLTHILVCVGTAGAGTYTIVWEYFAGNEWRSCTLNANTTNNWKTTKFVYIIVREVIRNMVRTSLTTTSGVTPELFWIRARLSSLTSITTIPKGTIAFYFYDDRRLLNSRFTQNEDVGVERMTYYPVIVRTFYSNTSFRIVFKLSSYLDEASPLSLVEFKKVTISRNGKPFEELNTQINEIGFGWYYFDIPAQYVKSPLVIRILGQGILQSDQNFDVLPKSLRRGMFWLEMQNFKYNELEALTYDDIETYEGE